ncbi:MAG TPA: PAS domain-containing sensor histidine kinase [Alphaproteobacteria bacterium]|nr:PAS domain-containing sensor histidine kinase [Alphaproteobacteria bacterium]
MSPMTAHAPNGATWHEPARAAANVNTRAALAEVAGGTAVLPGEALALLADGPPMYVASLDGKLTYANIAYQRLLEQRAQKAGVDVDWAGHFALDEIVCDVTVSGATIVREDVVETPAAVEFYSSQHFPIRDAAGKIVAVGGVYHNATREAQAWLETLAARERFQDISRLVSDWIWETDADFNFTYVSPRVMEVLQRHPRSFLGASFFDLGKTPEVFTRETRSPFRDVLHEILDGEGETRLFLVSGLPVFDDKTGVFKGYRGTARDVTEMKQREDALLRAKLMAEEANRFKGEFLANMSHELRTPLNAIIGFSEIMRNETFGKLGNDRYVEYSKDILDSSRHLLGIINDILDISKADAGKLQLYEEEVDLRQEVQDAARLFSEHAIEVGLKLKLDLPAETPPLWADRRKIKQILLNLLSNAIKFTPPGGEVRVASEIDGETGDLKIVVADSGIGIDQKDIDKVFSAFGQVESSLSRRYEGTGLGLPLSVALVELHGGKLELESAVGVGTKITVRLPARRLHHGETAAELPPSLPPDAA